MPSSLKMVIIMEGDIRIVSISGCFDFYSKDSFKEAVGGIRGNRMIVRLDELEYIDSSGLGELVSLGKRVKETGGRLALIYSNSNPRTAKLFRITGLEKIFEHYDSIGQALKKFGDCAGAGVEIGPVE